MRKRLLVLSLLVLCGSALAQDSSAPLFRDPSQPIEVRIKDLVGRLTLEEKASQLNHLNKGIPRLGVSLWGGWNQTLHGVWSKEPTTLFPAAIAMGATWDPGLVHDITSAMSDEARALYNAHSAGPRSPRPGWFIGRRSSTSAAIRVSRIQEGLQRGSLSDRTHGGGLCARPAGRRYQSLESRRHVEAFLAVYNVENGRQLGNDVVD